MVTADTIPSDLGIVLPAQWGRRRRLQAFTGTARLGAAIIREAWSALRYPPQSLVHQAARRFFFGAPDPSAPVSLDLACTLCGIDPDHVRRTVRARLIRRRSG